MGVLVWVESRSRLVGHPGASFSEPEACRRRRGRFHRARSARRRARPTSAVGRKTRGFAPAYFLVDSKIHVDLSSPNDLTKRMSSSTVDTAGDSAIGFNRASFEAFLASRAAPASFTQLRRTAFEAYQQKLAEPLDPEEWKRVELRTFRPERFQIQPAHESENTFDTLLQDRAEFAGQVFHVNGQCRQTQLDDSLTEAGVVFGDLAEIARQRPDVIEKYFLTQAVSSDADRFTAWHAAFCTGGTVLFVPAGVKVEAPLYSLLALSGNGSADFSHTLIILESEAEATLLEETASASKDTTGLHVGCVELLVAENAQLRYVQLQNWNEKTWHFAHQAARVQKSGSLHWTVGGIGSQLAHIHQKVTLDGPGAEADVNGVTFATDRQRHSYYTSQNHNAPHTRSDLLYKHVLADRARAVWRGMIRVEPEAQKTDGYQRSDALLLDPTCRNDAIPGLEIEADDVRCTHGATAGRVDEEQIFFCMSRGLTEAQASRMIVEGFFRTVYDRIPVDVVRESLSQAIRKKLGVGD